MFPSYRHLGLLHYPLPSKFVCLFSTMRATFLIQLIPDYISITIFGIMWKLRQSSLLHFLPLAQEDTRRVSRPRSSTRGLANFKRKQGHIIRYEFAWEPHLCVHISQGGRGIEFNRKHLFTNSNTLKVRLNDKVVGRTKLRKTQIMTGLLWAVWYSFWTSANKVVI